MFGKQKKLQYCCKFVYIQAEVLFHFVHFLEGQTETNTNSILTSKIRKIQMRFNEKLKEKGKEKLKLIPSFHTVQNETTFLRTKEKKK